MDHLFITSTNTHSPRWQQAFSGARIVESSEMNISFPPNTLGWLLLDGDNWSELIAVFLTQGIKVIAMTRDENPEQAKRAIAAGASGYVHYLAVPMQLQQVAQVVTAGGIWLGAELMRQLMSLVAQPQQIAAVTKVQHLKFASLTPREQAVAEAVAVGKTNKEVARLLDITERTVKAHLGAVFEKLGVRDRLQLVLAVTGKT
jgi:DNA-binding NarL/FixJ family response regulator